MLLSIVIPLYNEESSLSELFAQTTAALDAITQDWEVICVNDGSTDQTLTKLREQHQLDPRWKALSLSRNFGQQPAIWAGLNHATGDYVGIMDGDLQDDPVHFKRFFEELAGDTDIVYAIRTNRKEGFVRKMLYNLFYRLFRSVFAVRTPPDSGDFCLMKKAVLQQILSMPEHSLYIRGIRAWVGFEQKGIACERNPRYAGKPKYSLSGLFRLAWDGIYSFSDVPVRFLGRLGLIIILSSLLYAGYIIVKRLAWGHVPEGFTTLILVILFFGGVQLVAFRILGEYLLRIYKESRNRPLYIVHKKLGDL